MLLPIVHLSGGGSVISCEGLCDGCVSYRVCLKIGLGSFVGQSTLNEIFIDLVTHEQ